MTTDLKWSDEFITGMVDRLVEDWLHRMCNAPGITLFVYFRPSGPGTTGDALVLADFEQAPDGYEIARPERLSGAWTKEQCFRTLKDTFRRLPILPRERDEDVERRLEDGGFILVSEHHRFGDYPCYKNPTTGEVRYIVDDLYAHSRVLAPADMYRFLYDNWRPAAREDHDWFCSSMKRYFGVQDEQR